VLAENLAEALKQSKASELLLPGLVQKWTTLEDDDSSLFPLLEVFHASIFVYSNKAMASLAIAVGHEMAPFASVIYQRALYMVQKALQSAHESETNEDEYDFAVVALDLMGGLVQGLGEPMSTLIEHTLPSLAAVLIACLKVPFPFHSCAQNLG